MAYNERIIATSQSEQRRHRAARMLANVRPVLARLEQEETDPPATSANSASSDREYEVVWSGRDSLSKVRAG